MRKTLLFYLVFVGIFLVAMLGIIQKGSLLPKRPVPKATLLLQKLETLDSTTQPVALKSLHGIFDQFLHNVEQPLTLLLLQLIVILLAARIFGSALHRIGQPAVIGEIIAGIALGPSLLGHFFPSISHFLFPVSSLSNLQFLSQIGLVLFMFIIGLELDISKLQNRTHVAVAVSHASIVFPYFLGILVSYFIYPNFAPPGVSFLAFSLFMGIAMSITAFPVLARIIQERNLRETSLGALAITCAAADDVTAWCLLAVVIAIVKAGSVTSALLTVVLAIAFVFFMLKIVRPTLRRIPIRSNQEISVSKTGVAATFFLLLSSAYVAEVIGIHALFGAFIAGVVMPNNPQFKDIVRNKIEDISLLMLLPIFFAFSGLRTQLQLLENSPILWGITAIIIFLAVLGKFGGSAFAAKIMGQQWREALGLGILMNARGLVELVVLNIGYDLGVLSPQIFAMMVLMALVTTFMTGPSLSLIQRFSEKWRS